MRRAGLVLGIALLALAGAGFPISACTVGGTADQGAGRNPSVGSTTPTAPTGVGVAARAIFVETANAVCLERNDQLRVLPVTNSWIRANSAADYADRLLAIAAVWEQALARLRELPPPRGDEAHLAALYREGDALVGAAREMATALRAGDQATMDRVQAEGTPRKAKADEAYRAFGLTECAE